MNNQLVTIRVWGNFACFTRPEMKVERVSYPVMTPSAARGILEAIFWEPQIYYLIDSIHVIERGRWFSFRRNEVISVISIDSAKTWMKAPEKITPIQAGGGASHGTQRNMLALESVEYLITAEVHLTEIGRKSSETLQKYRAEIERRAKIGSAITVRISACANLPPTSNGKTTQKWRSSAVRLNSKKRAQPLA